MNTKTRIRALLFSLICATTLAQADVTLTHRYEFNGNLNDSVGAINATASAVGTYSEAPTFGSGTGATPAGATGSSQSVHLADKTDIRSGFNIDSTALSSTGSISLWFEYDLAKAANDTQVDYIFNVNTGMWNEGLKLSFAANTNNLVLMVGGKNTSNGTVSTTATYNGVAQNTWYHAAIVWDSSATSSSVSYYINGSLVGSRAIAGSITLSSLNVGNWSFPAATSTNYLTNQFQGSIYDLQIYSGQLDASQVAQLYAAPGSVIPEPATFACLLGAGLFACILACRIRRK